MTDHGMADADGRAGMRPGPGRRHRPPLLSRRAASMIVAAALVLSGVGTIAIASALPHLPGTSVESPPQSGPQSPPETGPQPPPSGSGPPPAAAPTHW
jgi:hypothetical protein